MTYLDNDTEHFVSPNVRVCVCVTHVNYLFGKLLLELGIPNSVVSVKCGNTTTTTTNNTGPGNGYGNRKYKRTMAAE